MAGHIATASSIHWGTPKHILEAVRRFLVEIELDPCASGVSQDLVMAIEAWQPPEHDGLLEPWGRRRVFCNAPFGRSYLFKDGRVMTGKEFDDLARAQAAAQFGVSIGDLDKKQIQAAKDRLTREDVEHSQTIGDWSQKACDSFRHEGATSILLLPAAVDTAHWQDVIFPTASAVCYPRGRLEFVGSTQGPSPMACALPYWGEEPTRFCQAFEDIEQIGHCDEL